MLTEEERGNKRIMLVVNQVVFVVPWRILWTTIPSWLQIDAFVFCCGFWRKDPEFKGLHNTRHWVCHCFVIPTKLAHFVLKDQLPLNASQPCVTWHGTLNWWTSHHPRREKTWSRSRARLWQWHNILMNCFSGMKEMIGSGFGGFGLLAVLCVLLFSSAMLFYWSLLKCVSGGDG